MIEQGVVLSVSNGFAKVRVGRNSACASCGKCGMTENQKHVDFVAANEVGALAGDTVKISLPETNSARLAVFGYFLPILPAIILLLVALYVEWPWWASMLTFFGGLAVGYAVVAIVDKVRKHKWMETPVITEIVVNAGTNCAVKKDDNQTDESSQNLTQINSPDGKNTAEFADEGENNE